MVNVTVHKDTFYSKKEDYKVNTESLDSAIKSLKDIADKILYSENADEVIVSSHGIEVWRKKSGRYESTGDVYMVFAGE